MDDIRYPIGKFQHTGKITGQDRTQWILEIGQLPAALRSITAGLSAAQLDTPYREGGWTVRQVIHHLADSHMNSFIRFKLAVTEEQPTIKPYFEERWAETADGKSAHIEMSLQLVEGLHARWVNLLRSMTESDFEKTFYHPESKKTVKLGENLGIYAWHGNHHAAQISALKTRKGW